MEGTDMESADMESRAIGCLMGLAVGDAVGTTLEFKPRGSFSPINDMLGGGPFNLKKGQWTDDTSMALCLAESLIYVQGFDAKDQMNRYCNWWQYGYLSSTGECFDIGFTVTAALRRYLDTGDPYAGATDEKSSGNGSLMRLAPVPIFYWRSLEDALTYSKKSSQTTHGSPECVDACQYFAGLLFAALNGAGKEELLRCRSFVPSTPKVQAIARGAYQHKCADEIRGSGYVIDALEAALWCFSQADNFRDAVLLAANLGDDADTTAAICGQIAGAFYGEVGIPEGWRNVLYDGDYIRQVVLRLLSQRVDR